ncbi:MAG TPA: hypothetical protein VEK77_07170 [Gemmatimonadales bacterium]|nr:hypothetical protein [Gemmatimonadales bacterium]
MNTPIWTDVAQTLAVLAALFFTGWEFRARAREQKFRNYLDGISGFVNLAAIMVEKAELQGLYDYTSEELTRNYQQLSAAQRARVHYCDTIIALCETVWLAANEKWLPADEWGYWKRWAHDLNGSPEFRWTLRWVEEEYDKTFISELRV